MEMEEKKEDRMGEIWSNLRTTFALLEMVNRYTTLPAASSMEVPYTEDVCSNCPDGFLGRFWYQAQSVLKSSPLGKSLGRAGFTVRAGSLVREVCLLCQHCKMRVWIVTLDSIFIYCGSRRLRMMDEHRFGGVAEEQILAREG
jgi:hypothetical protein